MNDPSSANSPDPTAAQPPSDDDFATEPPLDPRQEKLRAVLSDPDILDALERRDGNALKTALAERLRRASDPDEMRLLQEMMNDRRLLAKPLKKAPSLFTLNGVGTMLYGKSDFDRSDGTYIATQCFTFLYIPIWPLAQFWVRPADSNSFDFIGQVPLSSGSRTWRTVVSLIAVAWIAIIGFGIYQDRSTATVHIVNGLDIPVQVQVADAPPITVAPGKRQTQEFAAGTHSVRTTTADGKEIETLDAEFPPGARCVVYNVLGAAPVYFAKIKYTSKSTDTDDESEPEWLCGPGKQISVKSSVDYVFQEPPKTISTRSRASSDVLRTVVNLVSDANWETTMQLLMRHSTLSVAANFVESVAAVQPSDAADVMAARLLLAGGGAERAAAFARAARDRRPENLDSHRLYQEAMGWAGRADDVRGEYRERQTQAPDSAEAAYLRVRLEDAAEVGPLYAAYVAQFPDFAMLRHGYAGVLYRQRKFVDAVVQFDALRNLSPDRHEPMMKMHATALAGADRLPDAVALLDNWAKAAANDAFTRDFARHYALLCRQMPPNQRPQLPTVYYHRLDQQTNVAALERQFYVYLDLADGSPATVAALAQSPEFGEATKIMKAVWAGDLADALKQIETGDGDGLDPLTEEILLLLACEAAQAKKGDVMDELFDHLEYWLPAETDALREFATDFSRSPALDELDPQLQAVLAFVEYRHRPDLSADEKASLAATAREADVLRGIVTHALNEWPTAD